jgi:hypothetical protein
VVIKPRRILVRRHEATENRLEVPAHEQVRERPELAVTSQFRVAVGADRRCCLSGVVSHVGIARDLTRMA